MDGQKNEKLHGLIFAMWFTTAALLSLLLHACVFCLCGPQSSTQDEGLQELWEDAVCSMWDGVRNGYCEYGYMIAADFELLLWWVASAHTHIHTYTHTECLSDWFKCD